MPYAVAPNEVEIVVQGLLGSIDVDGGPTEEQLDVLWSISSHLWQRDDLRSAGLAPRGPEETAADLTDERARRRFHLVMVTLELCRHPLTPGQVARAEEYASAMSVDGSDLLIMRDWIDGGVGRAMEDWKRCFGAQVITNSEVSFQSGAAGPDEAWLPSDVDPVLSGRLEELQDLPEGSLGRAYLDFYRRNEIDVPGSTGAGLMAAVSVSHDMNHVIAGYEPTGQGEIALGAFQMAMADSEENLVGFLGNLLIHEAGVLDPGGFTPKSASLQRPGAIEMLGEAFERGSKCRADFTHVDHLAMAAWNLAEVREEFGVVPARYIA